MIKNIIHNILIVADDFDSDAIIKANKNYKFLKATNKIQIIELLKKNNISLIIFDVDLYGFDFIDILDTLQKECFLEESLVLALSKIDNVKLLKDVLHKGASDFFKKPFINEEFTLKIELLIKKLLDKNLILKQQKDIENNLNKLQEFIDSSINAIYIFENNICIECNYEGSILLGFKSKKEIINKHIFDIFNTVSQEHQELLLANTVEHNFQTTVTSKDNKIYHIQIKERNILFDTEKLKIISAMDITDIKKNEKIIAQKSKLASMGEMIGNIAHQWRQPLTAISIAASGIKLMHEFGIEDKNETIENLDNIVRNTKYLSTTIEDFQNFIRNDREGSTFFIKDVIQSALMIIDANIKLENVQIFQNYTKNFEITTIQNDLVQILLNIINNAIDALKNKQKQDKLIFINVYGDKDAVYISLLDSAGGISENILDKIFEPYFTTKHQAQGTGLGLYMIHQIISKLDGKIEVRNESFIHNTKQHHGAKFTIFLPLM